MNRVSLSALHQPTGPLTVVAVLLAFFVILAGCEPADEPAPEDPTIAPEEIEALTVIDVIQEDARFSELAAAVRDADLEQTLRGPGPFTVFAPTNSAFEALPENVRDTLAEDDAQDRLVEVLTYHVVSGNTTAEELTEMESIMTLHGSELMISVENGVVVLDGEARVTEADMSADNGLVHAIDAVLLPPEDDTPAPSSE